MAEEKKEVAEKVAETDKKKESMAAKKTEAKRLKVHNESSRLSLRTKAGRKKLLTLDQALQPHNFKQFPQKTQDMLKGKGLAASEIIKNINY